MSVLDGQAMRDDIVSRLLGGEPDLSTSKYLDRISELAGMEEAEHQFLIDPFDRSVALVFQMFQSTDLDPWDVDLSSFLEMFSSRIEKSENIDLPTCGRLIRMAWAILRNQASSLIERQERALDFEEDDTWDFEGGWETEFDDEDYNFSVGVLSGAADDVLPSIFEGRVHREEGRPVTLGELLMGLQEAGRLAEEQRTRERIAQERREALSTARERFSGSLHIEDLEGDLERTWNALRSRSEGQKEAVSLNEVSEHLMGLAVDSGVGPDEARSEAQVTALVSALFLTNRGYTEISQEPGRNGKVSIAPLWEGEDSFAELTAKLHPGEVGVIMNEQ
jgi:chromatin segregation and condensation protein Rec8/ScpA/Scc1 (kleisin family)